MRALTAAVVCAVVIAGGVRAKEPRRIGSLDYPAEATLEPAPAESSHPVTGRSRSSNPPGLIPQSAPAALAAPPVPDNRSEAPSGSAIAELDQLIIQLMKSGLIDEAHRLKDLKSEIAAKITQQLTAKAAESEKLAGQIRELQRLTGRQRQIAIRCQVLEMDPVHLAKLGLDRRESNGEERKILPASFEFTPFEASTVDEKARMTASHAEFVGEAEYAYRPCGEVEAVINQLKDASGFKLLASPSLVTAEGRPAVVHSGGEFPILVPQGNQATIQYRQFGVRLEAIPTYCDNGQIHVDLAAEVSERDFNNSVDVNGFRVPGITSRDINTGVDLKAGQTLLFAVGMSRRVVDSSEQTESSKGIKTVDRVTVIAISASPHDNAAPAR